MKIPVVLSIFGTRPEAVKMAPLVKALADRDDLVGIVAVTAQHRQMLDQVLSLFGLVPDFDLDIMRPGQELPDLTARILTEMTAVLRNLRPDVVVVQGDTTTAFVAALAAFYEKIAVAHVEAGLRTYDKYSPWPEEMNRSLVGRLCDYHFPPTARSKEALLKEGVAPEHIWVTGNTVVDALLFMRDKIAADPQIKGDLDRRFDYLSRDRRLILVTGHRRESFGEPFRDMCTALVDIAKARPDVEILYPVHLNPNVQAPVKAIMANQERVHLIEPIEYQPFVYLMERSTLIITDSGGVQEEAPSLGKPVLVTRRDTERPEAVEARTAMLVGTDRPVIVREALRLLDDKAAYEEMSRAHNPYGDGKSTARILDVLKTVKRRVV